MSAATGATTVAATAPLQCQVEAGRFSSTVVDAETVRASTIRLALRELRAGHGRGAALEVMYAGLKDQCPLTFRAPATPGGVA
ncbi:hypothetical protein [Nocardioides panaciterrulae]|uniref:Uncharacterized protein n=1 Tax=Nocardioides panaciterrulae TaxID=661492 RepID=A0A7Y9JD00_9ACTN|nr:hypothetical protein [Nocardioides panaciterrulae]NYD39941.1 hypothetical protein [Nocardioides panaciterrulae]NYD43973.1 hypothetical protein [Nocardioides panaciterrulae]